MALDWDQLVGPELTRSSGAQGARIALRGDHLDVSAASMPSIVSRAAEPRQGAELLLFDARTVVVRNPLALASGRIAIIARQLEFKESARFVVAAPLPQRVDDGSGLSPGFGGVDIVCETLVLTDAPAIVFTSRSGFANDRTLRILCSRVIGPGGAVVTSAEGERLICGTTLGASTPAGGSADVSVGDEAAYLKAFHDLARWPEAFARTLAAAHALDPFDPGTIEEIRRRAAGELDHLRAWRSPAPSAAVLGTLALIDARLDPRGRTPEYVPREELDSLLTRFKDSCDALTSGPLLQTLEDQILQGLKDRRLDLTGLSQVRDSIQTANDERRTLLDALGDALAQALTAGAQARVALERVRLEKERVRRDLEERIARGESGAQALKAARIVGLVGSLIPAVAPVALAVGAAAELAGTLVYRHNGGPDGKDVLTDLATALNKAKALQDALGAVRTSWESERRNSDLAGIAERESKEKLWRAMHPPPDAGDAVAMPADWKPPTAISFKNAALLDAVKLLGDLKGVADALAPPKPANIELTTAEQEDAGLQLALAKALQANDQASQANAGVLDFQQRIAATSEETRRWTLAESDLLRLDAVNDQEIEMWSASALRLRRSLIQRLWADLPDLRRALFYATGKRLPEELSAPALSLAMPAPSAEPLTVDGQAAAFVSERERIRTAALAVVAGVKEAVQNYFRTTLQADAYEEPSGALRANRAGDNVASEFLRLLNDMIEAALRNPAYVPVPLPLPMEFTFDERTPRRFLDAVVTDVVLSDAAALQGRSLMIIIHHPGFGRLWFDGVPHLVDLREGEGYVMTQKVSVWSADTPREPWSRSRAAAVEAFQTGSFRYAKLPLQAPYFITAVPRGDKKGDDWMRALRIESLSISFAVLR